MASSLRGISSFVEGKQNLKETLKDDGHMFDELE